MKKTDVNSAEVSNTQRPAENKDYKLISGPIFKEKGIKSLIVMLSNKNDFSVIANLNVNELEGKGLIRKFYACEKIISPLSTSTEIIELTEFDGIFFSISVQFLLKKTRVPIYENIFISTVGRREESEYPIEESHIINSTVLRHADFVPVFYDFDSLSDNFINPKNIPFYKMEKRLL